MITADASIWIDYFKSTATPYTEALDAVLNDSAQELVLLDVVLMEVLRGLRHQGLTVRSPLDLLVGAWCIRNGCDLIQNDRNYGGMLAFVGLRGVA